MKDIGLPDEAAAGLRYSDATGIAAAITSPLLVAPAIPGTRAVFALEGEAHEEPVFVWLIAATYMGGEPSATGYPLTADGGEISWMPEDNCIGILQPGQVRPAWMDDEARRRNTQ
jgi:hypothetical protein